MKTLGGVLVAIAAAVLAIPFLVVGAVGSGAGAAPASPASAMADAEIPPVLVPHYQAAPACTGLAWQVVAAVGWVESRHGRARRDPATGEWTGIDADTGATASRIVGPALDGSAGTRAIPATPESTAQTGDARWDHAVGPMQFLTSTFAAWATDANGDGKADPHNAYDAIATAGRYLCGGRAELGPLDRALRRYNNSAAYVAEVETKAIAYGMTPWGGAPLGTGAPSVAGVVWAGVDLAAVLEFALSQLGEPYEWGAEGPHRWDCSGLTQAAYAAVGIDIGRTTVQQVHAGREVAWPDEPLRPGDLVFTPRGDRPSGHVGLALDARHWVVAPRTGDVVRIATIPSTVDTVRRIVES
ncbi:MAG TPA: bifunctional lytic transglycosylase/C40 family peptidase [Acidimicrobiales bacterium]|nr:bifunctional lytic transglycosylase/C40 family peptidase [Acidimicrobiales bacterium]